MITVGAPVGMMPPPPTSRVYGKIEICSVRVHRHHEILGGRISRTCGSPPDKKHKSGPLWVPFNMEPVQSTIFHIERPHTFSKVAINFSQRYKAACSTSLIVCDE